MVVVGQAFKNTRRCPKCHGEGELVYWGRELPCNRCQGEGFLHPEDDDD